MLNPSNFMQSLKYIIFSFWTSNSQTAGMIVISVKLSTKAVKLMAPGLGALELDCGFNAYTVKRQKFFKNLLLCPWYLANKQKLLCVNNIYV